MRSGRRIICTDHMLREARQDDRVKPDRESSQLAETPALPRKAYVDKPPILKPSSSY